MTRSSGMMVRDKPPLLDLASIDGHTFMTYPYQEQMIRYLVGVGEFDTNDPCDEWSYAHHRPAEPSMEWGAKDVWYRGWEVGYDIYREAWDKQGWVAYKGGCDLDAPHVSGKTYAQVLNEIDDTEDE